MAQFDSSIIFRQTPYTGPTAEELQSKQNMNALRNTLGEGYSIDDPKVVNAMMARDPDMGLKLMTNANSMRKSASDVATAEQERMTTELDRYVPVALAVARAKDQAAWTELHGELTQVFPTLGRSLPTDVAKAGDAVQAYIDARRGLKGISSALPYQATEMGGYLHSFNKATGKFELVLDNEGNPMPANAVTTAGIGAAAGIERSKIGAGASMYGTDVRATTADANRVAAGQRQDARLATELAKAGVTTGALTPVGQQPTPDLPGAASNVPEAKRMSELRSTLPKARAALSTAESKLDDMTANLDALLKDPTLKNITGSEIAKYKGDWPTIFGTKSSNAQARIQQILAQGGFNELSEMRAASPTGGALGNVSNTEGEYLRAAFARLNQAQDYPSFVASLNELKGQIARSKARIRSTFDDEYGPVNNTGAAAPAGGAAAPAGEVNFGDLK